MKESRDNLIRAITPEKSTEDKEDNQRTYYYYYISVSQEKQSGNEAFPEISSYSAGINVEINQVSFRFKLFQIIREWSGSFYICY